MYRLLRRAGRVQRHLGIRASCAGSAMAAGRRSRGRGSAPRTPRAHRRRRPPRRWRRNGMRGKAARRAGEMAVCVFTTRTSRTRSRRMSTPFLGRPATAAPRRLIGLPPDVARVMTANGHRAVRRAVRQLRGVSTRRTSCKGLAGSGGVYEGHRAVCIAWPAGVSPPHPAGRRAGEPSRRPRRSTSCSRCSVRSSRTSGGLLSHSAIVAPRGTASRGWSARCDATSDHRRRREVRCVDGDAGEVSVHGCSTVVSARRCARRVALRCEGRRARRGRREPVCPSHRASRRRATSSPVTPACSKPAVMDLVRDLPTPLAVRVVRSGLELCARCPARTANSSAPGGAASWAARLAWASGPADQCALLKGECACDRAKATAWPAD